jgi:hypothetical protein
MTRPRTPTPVLLPPVRDTAGEFAELRRRYPVWAERFSGDEPVYAIPLPAVERLARSAQANDRPPFDAVMADAERAFTTLCEANHVVGFRGEVPISFPLLATERAELHPIVAAFGWPPEQLDAVRGLLNRGDEMHRRLRGVIGWLLTEPAFREQVAEVRHLFEAIPPAARPLFPLARLLSVPGTGSASRFRAFGDALGQLLDRWGLATLAAWDLPNPQGPLLPNYLSDSAPARPAHGVWVYVPVHYPLRGDDELQRQVVEFQRQQASELNIDPSFAGNTHHEVYDRMFRVIHLERAIRSRFDHPPRGLVARIEDAAATALHLSPERVQRLRKMIAQCQAGRRAAVRELNDRG